jgi:O-antigen/teichoic acid export membrane protein
MKETNKRLLKNSLLLGIAPFLPKIINVMLLPIMTKYLTDVDFGISGTISAYTTAIGAFSLLGLNVVLLNSFVKSPCQYKIIWRQIYGFLKIWMIVYACIQTLLLYLFIPREAESYKWIIIILTNFSTVFFGPTATIGSYYYIFNQQSFPIVWRSVLAGIITILFNYVLIVNFKLGYVGWYVGSFVGVFFSNASYWYVVNKKLGMSPIYNFKWKTIIQSLKVSLPGVPHYYSSFLLEGSGRMILDRYHIAQSEIGKVNIVQQIGNLFQLGVEGINNAIGPALMKTIKENDEKRLLSLTYVHVCFVFSTAFLLSLWSKEIFSLLISNKSLASTYPYFIIYLMALCYRPMYVTASNYFFYYEKMKQLLWISLLSGIIAFLLYLIFVPLYGIWGFLLGRYAACLYNGYAGFLSKVIRNYAKVSFPFISIMILQLFLTIIAYIFVEKIFVKSIISCIVLVSILSFYIAKQHEIKR